MSPTAHQRQQIAEPRPPIATPARAPRTVVQSLKRLGIWLFVLVGLFVASFYGGLWLARQL